jgi:predicted lipid-binding transport protein (Tim44 family)
MGGDGFSLDLILFAIVAAFLIIRLRSVLGRRDGHEPRGSDPFKQPPSREARDDNVVRLPDRSDHPEDEAIEAIDIRADGEPSGIDGGLAQIRVTDPTFDPNEFLSGARIAFEMILNAYAAGDTAALRPLLSPEVFGNFEQTMRDRAQAGETLEVTLVGIKSADIVEAYMAGRTAHLTIKFVSEQTSVTRNEAGDVVDGDPTAVTEVTDFWTFARDTRSRDPNWMLVATGAQA